MSSFKDLEMAAAVSAYDYISIKKSFLSKKAVYEPTQSPLKASVKEYAPAEGKRLERLLNLPLESIAAEIEQHGKPQPTAIGHYRLEVCLSKDRQFCAVQLFRCVDLKYAPCFEPRVYTGEEVGNIIKLF